MKIASQLTSEEILALDYVSFMGLLNETNRPPGGKDSMRRMAQNAFLTSSSNVLHAGCNTGFCSFELAHLAKCAVTGIDLNEKMIASALSRLEKEPLEYRDRISFRVADARQLPFSNDTFDLVMSGGSTAFIDDRDAAVREYVRVCKLYGFVGDVYLYYEETPPQRLVDEINKLLGIHIQVWGPEYWTSLYQRAGLEPYYEYRSRMTSSPSSQDVRAYCEKMIAPLGLSGHAQEVAVNKLFGYMQLFAENHRYLGYGVLLMRKIPEPEQVTLFGA